MTSLVCIGCPWMHLAELCLDWLTSTVCYKWHWFSGWLSIRVCLSCMNADIRLDIVFMTMSISDIRLISNIHLYWLHVVQSAVFFFFYSTFCTLLHEDWMPANWNMFWHSSRDSREENEEIVNVGFFSIREETKGESVTSSTLCILGQESALAAK